MPNEVKLPKADQRVMVTGLFAGLFSNHVCVVPDATDEEILAACNADEIKINPNSNHRWTRVIRTQKDIDELQLKPDKDKPGILNGALPGPCQECPPRIHMVVR